MEKILNIDGRQVKFKSTGAFLLKYKMQFGRDAIKDIYKMEEVVETVSEIVKDEITGEEKKVDKKVIKNIDALDLEVFYNLVWTMAKSGDPSIPPPIEWLDGFSEFPLMDIIPELLDMMFSCLSTTVQSKKKI